MQKKEKKKRSRAWIYTATATAGVIVCEDAVRLFIIHLNAERSQLSNIKVAVYLTAFHCAKHEERIKKRTGMEMCWMMER